MNVTGKSGEITGFSLLGGKIDISERYENFKKFAFHGTKFDNVLSRVWENETTEERECEFYVLCVHMQ